MSKKQFLELLIRSYGLTPKGVKSYRTEGGGGQFQIGYGWEGEGIDESGCAIIRFATGEGFNDAVHEILEEAKQMDLEPVYVPA